MNDWTKIARVEKERSYVNRISWPFDKYPDMPLLDAGSELTLLEAEGPGVVTCIHAAKLEMKDWILHTTSAAEPDAPNRMMIEITYDHHETPDISMPLMAFLGDSTGYADRYSTVYFAKVAEAMNCRLPVPFRKHIKIVIKNPTKTDLVSYMDIQWKKLDAIPEDCGYLRVCHTKGKAKIPDQVLELANISGAGTVKAQWFGLGCNQQFAWDSEVICEGNQEFYLDGEQTPSLEYLGSEDAYCHSWGMAQGSSDGYAAITEKSHPTDTRTQITMLRCRTEDSISFQSSLKLLVDYTQDYLSMATTNPLMEQGVFADRARVSFWMDYESCIYYYSK